MALSKYLMKNVMTPFCGTKLPVKCEYYDKEICKTQCPEMEQELLVRDEPNDSMIDEMAEQYEFENGSKNHRRDLNGNAERV